jgi:hypothetical protein
MGQVDGLFLGLPAAKQQLNTGKLNILAITSPERSSIAPPNFELCLSLACWILNLSHGLDYLLLRKPPVRSVNQVHHSTCKNIKQSRIKSKII